MYKKILLFLSLLCISLSLFSNPSFLKYYAYAQTPKSDVTSTEKEAPFYSPDSQLNDCVIPSASMSNSKIYVIGDSYASGLEAGLRKQLTDTGYEIIAYNAHVGRSITGGGNPPPYDALKAIEDDKDPIAQAGTVLIILGTNNDNYDKNIPIFLKKINEINGSSRKFWVNVGNSSPNSDKESANKAISKYSEEFNYTVIDWFSKYKENPSGMIGSDKLHPSPAGYKAMNELIITALGNAGYGSGNIPNSDGSIEQNKKVIWQYLIGKGLTPIQTAAIMGNLQGEGGFEPRRVEYAYSEPPHLSDDVPPNVNSNGAPGYGIAQWTSPDRKQGLKDMANERGVKAGNLILQLDYLWKELNGSYSNVLKELKQLDDLFEATKLILFDFESPKNQGPEVQQERYNWAKIILKKYSGISGDTFSSGSNCSNSQSSSSAGQGGWDTEGENALVFYSQYDPKWANNNYGSCSISTGGCGPTSMAMVVATLNKDKSIDPPKMVDFFISKGNSCGTNWNIWPEAADKFNLKYTSLGTSLDKAAKILNEGGLVIGSFGISSDGPETYFTSGRHLMVIRKVSADGQTFYIADPIQKEAGAEKNTKGYTKEMLVSRTPGSGGALNAMWGFTK